MRELHDRGRNRAGVEACQSPVWDTCLSLIALHDAGVPGDHEAVIRGADWLLERADPRSAATGPCAGRSSSPVAGRSSSPTPTTPTSTTRPRSCWRSRRVDHPDNERVRAAIDRGVALARGDAQLRRRLGRVRRRQLPRARARPAVLRLRRGDRPAERRRHRPRRRDARRRSGAPTTS